MMDLIRRNILTTGVAATAMAAAPGVFGPSRRAKGGAAMFLRKRPRSHSL